MMNLFRKKPAPVAAAFDGPVITMSDAKRGQYIGDIKRHEESIAHREKVIAGLIEDQKDEMLVLASIRVAEARINEPLIELAAERLDRELALPDLSAAIADAPAELMEAAE